MNSLPGTPSWLGITNDQRALELLLEHGELTRNQLRTLTGLSKPTAAQIVGRLEAVDLIHPVGERSGGRGPNAISYGIKPGRYVGVAIDYQVEMVRARVVDVAGGEYPVFEAPHDAVHESAEAVERLKAAVAEASAHAGGPTGSVTSVVVGVPAEVNTATGELSFMDDMPGWPEGDVNGVLSRALGCSVTVVNDVKVSAVAERQQGAGQHLKSFALLWVGKGLGVAIDLRGTVISGASGGAGEIGYLSIPSNAAGIDADAADLQDLVSSGAIRTIAAEYGLSAKSFDTLLHKIDQSASRNEIFRKFADRIAVAVEPVVAVLDPEAVILTGPVGALGGGVLADAVQTALERNTRWRTRIESTRVGHLAALAGAECVLRETLREKLFASVR